MAKSLNSVNITGYLGQDPRFHVFDDGTEVCNLSLAVSRQKKQDGEWVDDTLWLEVKVFGKQAKPCSEWLAKGSFVAVTGQLAQPRTWEDDSGNTRVSMVVDHATVTFGPRVDGNSGGQQQQRQAQSAQRAAAPSRQSELVDDDIPW